MSEDPDDRTASLMTPARLAQLKVRPTPAASPSAWLDQMAADAGSVQVRRLAELRRQLESQVHEADVAGVATAVQALADAMTKLDFAQVEPKGWLARATGKGKQASAGFVAQYDLAQRVGEDLADKVRSLQKKQQAQGGGIDRTVVEVDVEVRAIEKIMDQGARWLQDMRSQLKTREAQGGDGRVQQQIREDTARCELLVVRLKQLRATISTIQPAIDKCKGLAPRRAGVQQSLQKVLEGEWKAWQKRVAPVAEEASATGSATEGVARAREAQQALASALQQAGQECSALQSQEEAVAGELAEMQASLQAAA
jgi:DNA repair exonuclease SbcCD ATPase subunit